MTMVTDLDIMFNQSTRIDYAMMTNAYTGIYDSAMTDSSSVINMRIPTPSSGMKLTLESQNPDLLIVWKDVLVEWNLLADR